MNIFEVGVIVLLLVLFITIPMAIYIYNKAIKILADLVVANLAPGHKCPKCGRGVSYHAYVCYHCFTKLRWI